MVSVHKHSLSKCGPVFEDRKNEICERLEEAEPKLVFHSSLRLGLNPFGPQKGDQSHLSCSLWTKLDVLQKNGQEHSNSLMIC